jgi:hypothetical protein
MLRNKIVKQALQQGFASRSRWLLHYLGLNHAHAVYQNFGQLPPYGSIPGDLT